MYPKQVRYHCATPRSHESSHARVAPGAVTDIIISHVHWDHLDGADLFPNARIWIQKAEYEHYVGADGQPLDEAIDTVDAQMLARLRRAGRVQLVDGDAREVMPGITVYTGGYDDFVGVNFTKHRRAFGGVRVSTMF